MIPEIRQTGKNLLNEISGCEQARKNQFFFLEFEELELDYFWNWIILRKD